MEENIISAGVVFDFRVGFTLSALAFLSSSFARCSNVGGALINNGALTVCS